MVVSFIFYHFQLHLQSPQADSKEKKDATDMSVCEKESVQSPDAWGELV